MSNLGLEIVPPFVQPWTQSYSRLPVTFQPSELWDKQEPADRGERGFRHVLTCGSDKLLSALYIGNVPESSISWNRVLVEHA